MYHYVRDYKKTSFPKIKGLDINDFKTQIKYLKKNYNILNPYEIHEIIEKKKNFSEKDCWITFDDGYIDHYEYVLPELKKNGIKATFYPPVISATHSDILDPTKIHYILSVENNIKFILNYIKDSFLRLSKSNDEDSFYKILNKIDTSDRFDKKETVYIKILLQKALPLQIRNEILDDLFKKFISGDIPSFSKNIYMSTSQIKELYDNGHEIGLHGYDHLWMGSLNSEEQKNEITTSLNFWKNLSVIKDKFTMCYPYGDYNEDTLKILSESDCICGLLSSIGPDPIANYQSLELPRYDTNDFPK